MSTTASQSPAGADVEEANLNEKQRQILMYLRENDNQTYFKSRLVGKALELSAKEVGTNMPALADVQGITIEKWGYSGATTWKVIV